MTDWAVQSVIFISKTTRKLPENEASYADALELEESRKLDNILRFGDFIKEENLKDGKKPNKVKTAKDYNEAAKDSYVKLREDYIHSFIDAHERGIEAEEEE